MPSPDISRYVDLTILDPESQTIFEDALDYALYALPEFQPREGTIELVLLQAMALQVREVAVAINRLPGAITQVLLSMLDLERQEGAKASTYIKFTGSSTTSFSIPLGTRLYYIESTDATPLLLETTSASTITHTKVASSASQTLTTLTVTTSTMHGLSTGDVVSLSGFATTALNVTDKAITVTGLYTFTITMTDSASRTGASGTVTPAATIPATGLVAAQTSTIDSGYNGLAAGTALNLLSVIPAVSTAKLGTSLTGGASAETDDEYFTRATATMSRLSTALVTASQAEGFVLDVNRFPDVYRCKVSDTTSAGRVTGISGSMLIVVAPVDFTSTNVLTGLGDGSITNTSSSYGVLDEVRDAVAVRIHSGLSTTVTHPALLTVTVTASVKAPDGSSAYDAEVACEAALADYLSANTWPWDTTIRVNELIVLLRNTTVSTGTLTTPAATYVTSVSITPTDAWVPTTSTANRFTVSGVARSSNVVTATVGATHGISIGVGETLYLKVSGVTDTTFNTSTLVAATSASGNQFTFAQTGTNGSSSGGYITALAKKLSNGDIQILDPAPLVASGTHDVTVS